MNLAINLVVRSITTFYDVAMPIALVLHARAP